MSRSSVFRLNERQEELLADKVGDLANYFAIGFVITRLLGETKDFVFGIVGGIIYVLLLLFSLWLRK